VSALVDLYHLRRQPQLLMFVSDPRPLLHVVPRHENLWSQLRARLPHHLTNEWFDMHPNVGVGPLLLQVDRELLVPTTRAAQFVTQLFPAWCHLRVRVMVDDTTVGNTHIQHGDAVVRVSSTAGVATLVHELVHVVSAFSPVLQTYARLGTQLPLYTAYMGTVWRPWYADQESEFFSVWAEHAWKKTEQWCTLTTTTEFARAVAVGNICAANRILANCGVDLEPVRRDRHAALFAAHGIHSTTVRQAWSLLRPSTPVISHFVEAVGSWCHSNNLEWDEPLAWATIAALALASNHGVPDPAAIPTLVGNRARYWVDRFLPLAKILATRPFL